MSAKSSFSLPVKKKSSTSASSSVSSKAKKPVIASSSSAVQRTPPPTINLPSEDSCKVDEVEQRFDPRFKSLASDNVILILDFMGGEVTQDLSSISLLIKNCYGRFGTDSSIKFLYRYGSYYTNEINLEGMMFIFNEQFRQCKRSNMETRILNALCRCSGEENVSDANTIIQQLDNFSKENRQLCLSFQQLNFYGMETFWEVIEKCFEVFPNFEKLKIGFYPDPPTKVPRRNFKRKYHIDLVSFPKALEKSNMKCKKLVCHRNVMKGDLAFKLPLLEKYKVIGTDHLKQIDHLEELKNLKHLCLVYHDARTYGMEFKANDPQFFISLSKCTNLTRLKINGLYMFGEEFIHINNSLPNLTYLNLKKCFCQNTDGIFNAIGTFKKLKTLILGSHEQNCVAKLGNLKQLEYLEASDLSAKDVNTISQLVNLKSLIAEALYITDEEGKDLEKLKNLEQFKFSTAGDMYFGMKLITFLFDNLNVKKYEINTYRNSLDNIPKDIQQRMNGRCDTEK